MLRVVDALLGTDKMDDMNNAKIEAIAQRFDLKLILLFGSAVRGPVHQSSDVDIAVRFASSSAAKWSSLAVLDAFSEQFPGLDLDVAVINFADPLFLKQILSDCRLLYGDIRELNELKIYAFKRYNDHKRYLDLESQFVNRAIGRPA